MNKLLPVRILVVLGCIGGLLSLLGFFGQHHYVFELIASFKVHYLLALVGVLLVALLIRFHLATVFLLVVVGIHGFDVAKYYVPQNAVTHDSGRAVRVMTTNLLISNQEHRAQINHVELINPDIIVFQEYTREWHDVLSTELNDYPYVITAIDDTPFGIALYSKYELINAEELEFAGSAAKSLQASINVDGAQFRLIGTHPVPPMSESLFSSRNRQIVALGNLAAEEAGSLVLAGDLNTVIWSTWFKDLKNQGGLVDTRLGFGILATWPARLLGLGIPIDHVLVSDDITVLDANAVKVPDSDHRSYWTDLIVQP